MNKKKKGFTLVELLVVIAILAILATVSILGYTSFTKKATISNDESLCAQMNLILQAKEQEAKLTTFSEVVDALRENGFILANMNPTTQNYYYAWNAEENRMMLTDEKGAVVYPKEGIDTTNKENWYFAVASKEDAEKVMSITDNAANTIYAPKSSEDVKNIVDAVNTNTSGTIVFASDVQLSTTSNPKGGSNITYINITDENATLDINLGGNTLTVVESEDAKYNGARAITIKKGTVTVENGTIAADEKSYGGVRVDGGNVTIKDIETSNANSNGLAIRIANGGTVTVSNTIINSTKGGCIASYGDVTVLNGTYTQTGDNGETKHCAACVHVGIGGSATIKDGEFNSENYALYICNTGGTINVEGGNFKKTAGGTALIQVDNTKGNDPIVADSIITISGGSFDSATAKMFKINDDADAHVAKIVITGGTFNGKEYSKITEAEWKAMCNWTNPGVVISGGTVTITKN